MVWNRYCIHEYIEIQVLIKNYKIFDQILLTTLKLNSSSIKNNLKFESSDSLECISKFYIFYEI